MNLLVITREQAEMMDADPLNTIKLIILIVVIGIIWYYIRFNYLNRVKPFFKRIFKS